MYKSICCCMHSSRDAWADVCDEESIRMHMRTVRSHLKSLSPEAKKLERLSVSLRAFSRMNEQLWCLHPGSDPHSSLNAKSDCGASSSYP